MLDIVAAHDEEALTRADHQGLDHRQSLLFDRLGDAGHAPFARGDASRGTPGVGLGLSLAQAVAKLHGSALEMSDLSPGLRVLLTIPADSVPAAPPASDVPAPADPARMPGIAATSP